MAKHNELGKKGEEQAAHYLHKKGYKILMRNWQYQKAEIDIIAQWKESTVFIEVKTRSNNYFGYPEQSISNTKKRLLTIAAEAYLYEYGIEGDIRFDVVAITMGQYKTEIYHIEDAFFGYD